MRAGFIGLGSQGGGMAEMIARKGHELHVWARRPEAAEPYARLGAIVEETPAAVAAAVDVMGLCVISDRDVLELVMDKGLLVSMKPGSTLLIHSTIRPSTCRMIAEEGAKRSVRVLDAPVSGSGEAALAQRLLVMVGGPIEALEHARPVIESFANPIVHLGPIGAGQVAKLVNNILLIANMNLAQAALAFGEQLDMNRKALSDLILQGSGRSFAMDALVRLVAPANAAHTHTLFEKDIVMAEELAAEAGLSLTPLDSAARDTLAYLKRIEVDG